MSSPSAAARLSFRNTPAERVQADLCLTGRTSEHLSWRVCLAGFVLQPDGIGQGSNRASRPVSMIEINFQPISALDLAAET